MGGIVLTNSPNLYQHLFDERFYAGSVLDPHSAWLLRRSLQTLAIRVEKQIRSTREIVAWMGFQPEVGRVYFSKGDGLQLQQYGGIFFFEFEKGYENLYEPFTKLLKLFSTGTGMACVTSMIAQPWSGSHASLSDEEKTSMGITKNLVRICVGLEDPEDLKQDLRNAFDQLPKPEKEPLPPVTLHLVDS